MAPKKINPQKAAIVSNLKDLVSQAKSVAVVDYKGLKVSQVTELRRAIKKAGGQIVVTKNTLFSIASGIPDLKIDGPSAYIFSLTDEISAVKAVADFAKKNSLPTFKLGLLGDKVLNQSEISHLASLPGRDQLIAQTVGSLKTPLYRLVISLNWNITKLVRILKGVTN